MVSPKQESIKIANPLPGHRDHLSRAHADRLLAQGGARFDGVGRLLIDHHRYARGLLVKQFSGFDAFPARAVLPPSPEVMRRQGSRYMSVAEVMAMRRERNLAARTTVPI